MQFCWVFGSKVSGTRAFSRFTSSNECAEEDSSSGHSKISSAQSLSFIFGNLSWGQAPAANRCTFRGLENVLRSENFGVNFNFSEKKNQKFNHRIYSLYRKFSGGFNHNLWQWQNQAYCSLDQTLYNTLA